MTVHFLHIRKAGGSAIKEALRQATGIATPYGPISAHRHRFRLGDVPPGHLCCFVVRDPASRFVSGFNSRLRQGRPRYNMPWTEAERTAFAVYPTADALAQGLADDDPFARRAMGVIGHLRHPLTHWLRDAAFVEQMQPQILYVARQETLSSDWEELRRLLELPDVCRLPDDPVRAHRTPEGFPTELGERGREAVRRWYAEDYEILDVLEPYFAGRRS